MKYPQPILLFMGVLVWYMASIMVNVHWKSTFKSHGLTKSTTSQYFQYAIFYTTIQFGTGALASFILIVLSGKFKDLTSISLWWRKGLIIGSLFCLGQLSTNISLTMTSVTLTHIVKTLEPLLALLWALTILKSNISYASIAYMQIMLVGVLLTGYSEVSFNLTGVTFAIVSNVALSLRNLFIKLSNKNEIFNVFQLFFLSCSFGFFFSSTLYILLLQSLFEHNFDLFSKDSMKMGMYFSGQHMMSYFLLYYISITSHALMNCLKRGLIMFVAAILLEVQLPNIQICGIIITIIGSIFYVFESKKPLNDKTKNKESSNLKCMCSQTIGNKCRKSHKLLLLLPIAFLLGISLTVIKQYNTNRELIKEPELIKKPITAVWAFDAPLNMRSLELVNTKLDTSITNLSIFCYNVQKCKTSVDKSDSKRLSIQIKQLKAFDLSENTPLAAWVASHPINKIKSLSCFPIYFHKMMYLSTLWKYGGIVIDMAMDVLEKSDMKDSGISSILNGCMLDQQSSSIILCNLLPQHKYTEILIGKISKLFEEKPNSCKFVNSLENLVIFEDNIVTSGLGYSIPSTEINFGLLGYGTTRNLGDEMQSLGAAHILPYIHSFIDRQSFRNPTKTNLTYIGNAWWDSEGILFKDIPNLQTIPVAVHIHPSAYKNVNSSKHLFNTMAPIGARDLSTYEMLIKYDIKSTFTGCLTLWMQNQNQFTNLERNDNIIVADIQWENNPLPKSLKNVKYLTHVWREGNSDLEAKYIAAYNCLMQYAQAKVVVTSRIHVALPCVAMGTPVIFLNSKKIYDNREKLSPRLGGLLDLFHTVDMYTINEASALTYLKNFNWDSPPPNPNVKKVKALKIESRKILERIPELAVSMKVLGFV